MEELFRDPPREFRMLQIVHELGPRLKAQAGFGRLAQLLSERGYGGAVGNVEFSDHYLESEEEWQVFVEAEQAFKRAGLVFWLYDEKGYPSLKAGGIVLRDHPEYRALGVVMAKTEGEGEIVHKLPADEYTEAQPLYACALPAGEEGWDLERAVDLRGQVRNGSIRFQAPAGKWAVMSFHVQRVYRGTHAVANVSDTLPYPNILDREATAYFLKVTHEAYKAHLGARLAQDVAAIFTDEPSLMTVYLKQDQGLLPVIPWSRSFRDEFRRAYRYDVVPMLPALFVDCGPPSRLGAASAGRRADSRYVRLDFWGLVARLIEENFYGQIQDWCCANGIAASGHVLCEENLIWHAGMEGNLYRDLRRMDVPGIDMLSSNPTELVRAGHLPIPKLLSSVTHMTGARQCMSETSSHVQRVNKLPCSDAQRFGTINWQYALGLTLVTSYYGLDEMAPEQMRRFNDHIGRLGALLTDGVHVADIGVYYPIQSVWAQYTPTAEVWAPPGERAAQVDRTLAAASNHLLRSQLDFDYLDDQAILEAKLGDGRLNVKGEGFRCVVLAGAHVMPAQTLAKLAKLVEAGGALVVTEALPELGLTPEETNRNVRLCERLRSAQNVVIAPDAGGVVAAVGCFVEPDLRLDKPCPELMYCHRRATVTGRKAGRDVYFLSNSLDQPVTRRFDFRATGQPQLWHPTTGEIKPLPAVTAAGRTVVELSLEPFEGVFVVF